MTNAFFRILSFVRMLAFAITAHNEDKDFKRHVTPRTPFLTFYRELVERLLGVSGCRLALKPEERPVTT